MFEKIEVVIVADGSGMKRWKILCVLLFVRLALNLCYEDMVIINMSVSILDVMLSIEKRRVTRD